MHQVLSPGRDFGKVLRQKQTAGLLVSESVYLPNMKIERHSHTAAFFCFVLEGFYVETLDHMARLCKPATSVFHPAGEIHSNVLLNYEVRDLTVEIGQGWLQHFNLQLNALGNPYDYPEVDTAGLAKKISEELDSSDEASNLALEALILDVIVKTSRRRKGIGAMPRWLRQAREILGETFNSRFTIADIAENVGVHPVYLASEFNRHCGCTIGEYVRHLRVRYACHQLTSSTKPLAEIASAAGFYDQSHFTRTFRKIVGLTPKRFRAYTALNLKPNLISH